MHGEEDGHDKDSVPSGDLRVLVGVGTSSV